jgi:predicted O-linked N-acetylglucosamine transferase (SPINDLY family)
MATPKGGRGKKAPYRTQQMRVPVPIKDQVNILISKFRDGIFDNSETYKSIHNLTSSSELKSLQDEIEDLKAALDESDQQIDNLNTDLANAQLKIQELNLALEEERNKLANLNTNNIQQKNLISKKASENLSTQLQKTTSGNNQKPTNLNTGIIQQDVILGQNISEGEARKLFNISRDVLRTPREKGERKVTFKNKTKLFTLEYIGQPRGVKTPHYWKVAKIEEAQSPLSLLS